MEPSNVVLFYDKCRLCLMNPGQTNIFETQDLQHDIAACTGVKVFPDDNFPDKICSKCLKVVTDAKELRLVAVKSDKSLKTLFMNDSEDSRDTLCLDEDLEPSSMLQCQLEIQSHDDQDSNASKSGDESGHLVEKKGIKVRKDLYTPILTQSVIPVRCKEDYAQYKKMRRLSKNKELTAIYECETCKNTYESWKKLYLHSRTHNRKMCCPIDVCGKKFATKGDLEKHLRTHTGVKPYTCDICDMCFAQTGALKLHKERVHYVFIVP